MGRFLKGFALGALAGGLFLAALLLLDVDGFGTLVLRDKAVLLPLVILLINLCCLFGILVAVSTGEDSPAGGRPIPDRARIWELRNGEMKPAGRRDC